MQAGAPPLGYTLCLFLRAFFSFLVPISISKLQMCSAVNLKYTGGKNSLRMHCLTAVHCAQEYRAMLVFCYCLVSLVCLHTAFKVF